MAKYRKKPVVVEAEQYLIGKSVAGVTTSRVNGNLHTTCVTVHGQVTHVASGDWVITEADGVHHYPCKPDVFAANYDPVEES